MNSGRFVGTMLVVFGGNKLIQWMGRPGLSGIELVGGCVFIGIIFLCDLGDEILKKLNALQPPVRDFERWDA